MLREKEQRFAQEQQDNDRRLELAETLKRNAEEISKVCIHLPYRYFKNVLYESNKYTRPFS